jgi:phenylalanyl-tRNA synthetase beta chain
MYLSYSWLKEFVDFDLTPQELDSIFTMLGIEVEKIEYQNEKYNNFFTAEVIKKEKHPNADKLSICNLSLSDRELQVICGAPNVEAGQKVILGISGAVVPNGGFTLEKRKIRGVESSGMICSQVELGIGENSSGIHILPNDTPVGIPLADYLGLNDIIFEISVTPNKSDCLSHLGIARELSAYLRKPIKYETPELIEGFEKIEDLAGVTIEDPDKCLRYTARVIYDCKITESPEWLKIRLKNAGLRSINTAVDVTNLVLMESGQPLHAFDLDMLKDKKIIVKTVSDSTKFTSLDGKERILDSEMLMICDAEKPLAIGGIMGGENSEISVNTKKILLESAFFNPISVRKTSKKLSLQSDSSYRFERGVDLSNVPITLDRAAQLIAELTGGKIASGRIDVYPKVIEQKVIKLRYHRVSKIIGIEFSNEQIVEMLQALHFTIIEMNNEHAIVRVPYFRVDAELEVDLIEEIARLYNYDNITPHYSSEINFQQVDVVKHLSVPVLRNKIRNWFVSSGFNEILTQNQTDPRSAKFYSDDPIEIANPLGEELSIMRPGFTPSFLKVINRNHRNGNLDLRIFEIGKTFKKENVDGQFIEGISETEYLAVAITGSSFGSQWGMPVKDCDFYDIKGIAENLFKYLRINDFHFNEFDGKEPLFSKNTLMPEIFGKSIGYVGEIKKESLKYYDIEKNVFMIIINLKNLYDIYKVILKYSPISQYPKVTRDLAFVFPNTQQAGDVLELISKSGGELLKSVNLFDLYEGKNIGDGKKSLAFSLTFSSKDRTLTDDDIDPVIKYIIKNVEINFKAQLRQ